MSMPVREAAALAKLTIDPADERRLAAEFEDILRFASQLQAVDTEGVPMTHHIVPLQNVLRDDVDQSGLPREVLLANAPAHDGGLISVPKTFD